MFQKILIPLDGSALAERAIPYATALALAFDGRLTMLGVAETIATGNARSNAKVKDTALRMDYLVRQLRDAGLPPQRGRVHLVTGRPAHTIIDYVKRNKYDLVVMSTHGRTGVLRAALGSVADGVIQHAPSPVLVVRPPEGDVKPSPIRRIIVGFDGSSMSATAMDYAVPLAKRLGASLQLVSVISQGTYMTDADSRAPVLDVAFVDSRARSALDAAAIYLEGQAVLSEALGIETETLAAPGNAADVITGIARDRNDALVILTTHGRRGLARTFLGSVTGAVVRESHAPVLVLRPGLPSPVTLVEPARAGTARP